MKLVWVSEMTHCRASSISCRTWWKSSDLWQFSSNWLLFLGFPLVKAGAAKKHFCFKKIGTRHFVFQHGKMSLKLFYKIRIIERFIQKSFGHINCEWNSRSNKLRNRWFWCRATRLLQKSVRQAIACLCSGRFSVFESRINCFLLKAWNKKVVDSTFFNVLLSLTISINIFVLIIEVMLPEESTSNSGMDW